MSLISLPIWQVPSPGVWSAAIPAVTDTTLMPLTASGAFCGAVFLVPRTGTLETLELYLTVSNAPDNPLRVSFQSVDLTNGISDGTQSQFRDFTVSATGWYAPGKMTSDGTDTGTPRSVTAGELLSFRIEFTTFVAGDSVQGRTLAMDPSAPAGPGYAGPFYVYRSPTTKATTTAPVIALKYSDGTYAHIAPMWYPVTATNTVTFNDTSTPDERGLRFVAPAALSCGGAWLRLDLDGVADVVLYNAAGTVIGSCSLDPDVRANTAGGNTWARWPSVTLTAGATYRVTVKPTSGTSVGIYDFDVSTNALLGCFEMGSQAYYTQRTDAGAWTDVDTKWPNMGLLFDGIDVPVGAAGRVQGQGVSRSSYF